jgi:serine/threonine protein kinase
MSTPDDVRPASGMGTPNDVPEQLDDGVDLTSRMDPPVAVELPPLPAETSPGHLRLVPKAGTVTRPPTGAPHDELIGRRCGGYVIEKLLGEGGMGKVYSATNPRMGKRAAVKVILPEHSRNPLTIIRFLQEAKAAAQIDDPNIVDLLDASELEDGRAYLLMPFVEGTSLEELCNHLVLLPLEMAASILFQICGGLDAAHHHGIVHRDIKPQNILVGPRQQRAHFVRIVDFGIAKLLDPHLAGNFKTQTKMMMGTPGYMAPEQASGERDVDARADVYAVAVVAYRMLTGRRPYMAETLYALIESQASNAPFPRPRELRPDIPAAWDEAIMAALVNKRDKRLATVREFALRLARGIPDGDQMLRALAPRLAESPLPPNAPTLDPFLDHDIARRTGSQRHRAGPRRRRVSFAAWQLAALAILLLGVGGVLGGSLRGPREQAAQSPPGPLASSISSEPSKASSPSVAKEAFQNAAPSGSQATPPSGEAAPLPSASVASAEPHKAEPVVSPAPAAPVVPERVTSRAAPAGEARGRAPSSVGAKTVRSPAVEAPLAAGGSASAGSKPSTGPLSRDEAARLARVGVGMLIVNAQPWAQISINGRLEGFTPRRKELPAGRYTVRMTKNDRSEQVEVTVTAGQVTTLERSFR